MHPFRILTWTLTGIVLFTSFLFGCEDYDANMTRTHLATATTLAPVVQALETYREANGAYPESLDELIPDYLATMPKMPEGLHTPWYERKDARPGTIYRHTDELREYFLTVSIPSTAALQYPDTLSYYPKRWRPEDFDKSPAILESGHNHRIVLDDDWVRYCP